MDMTEIAVRLLDESEWALYRDVRLRALAESPDSFSATLADEAERDEQFWRDRMTRSYRLLAERGPLAQGIVSLGPYEEDPSAAEVFGLYVVPDARGSPRRLATRRGCGGSGNPAGLPAALLLGGDRQCASGRLR